MRHNKILKFLPVRPTLRIRKEYQEATMRLLVTLSLTILMNLPLVAADKSLRTIEDDMKFSNARHFIKLGEEKKGIAIMKEYLEVYIHGNHRFEAYREIARYYIKRFDYQEAVNVYQKMYQEFGGTEEGVEGYYYMGICYQRMGFDDRARNVYQAILTHHADTSLAQRARMQLDLLTIMADADQGQAK